MLISNSIGIVADDLTGANDTALQFFMKGSNTEIILDVNSLNENHLNVETWGALQRNKKYTARRRGKNTFLKQQNF